jgi:Ca2+-binding RTX toxin-like protein
MNNTSKFIMPLQVTGALGVEAAGYTIPGVGNQTLYGDAGKNVLNGGSGMDMITGGLGADTISAGTGDDTIRATSLAELSGDRIDGGLGFDELEVDLSASASAVSFAAFDPVLSGVRSAPP